MKSFVVAICSILVVGCAEKAHDIGHSPEQHSEMVLDSSNPAAGEYSLYQVDSEWKNQDGDALTLSSLEGRTQVVAMTYTSCEVSCPRIVASMKHIQSSTGHETAFVLISIDPERDSVGALATYAEKMDMSTPRWNLLTGSADDIQEMAALLGVRYRKMADGEFAHSNIVTVLNEQGTIVYQQKGLGSDLTAKTIDFLQ